MSEIPVELKVFARRHRLPRGVLEELYALIVRLVERVASGEETAMTLQLDDDRATLIMSDYIGDIDVTEAEETIASATRHDSEHRVKGLEVGGATLSEDHRVAETTVREEPSMPPGLLTPLRLQRTPHDSIAAGLGLISDDWEMVSLDHQGVADALFFDDDEEREALGPRYEDLGVLGEGGMGEVRRVRDRDLNRKLAMKIARPRIMKNPELLARFIEEAQVGAQLQHPGVVPVHEIGHLPDGRFYFTMREIKGRELSDVISEVHDASQGEIWKISSSGWTFRRLITTMRWVCETVGYAHQHGVVHRDLKPSNIMVGETDEVLVVDWGIAKVLGRRDHLAPDAEELKGPRVSTDRSRDDSQATRMGVITGTLSYMPVEQAAGEVNRINPSTDVYALGAILYEILSGRPPYRGRNPNRVIFQISQGPPPSVQELSPWQLPEGLVEICEQAMQREQSARFPDAREMANALGAWLEGVKRREEALEVIGEASAMEEEITAMQARAVALHEQSVKLLEEVPSWAGEEDKHEGWDISDEAEALEREIEARQIVVEQTLQIALTHAPEFEEIHAALAALYQGQHQAAETARDERGVLRAQTLLRTHTEALPLKSSARSGFMAYLKGDGAVTLVTEPPGAAVRLLRYEKRHRRLHAEPVRELGETPLVEIPLEKGSCLLEIKKEGYDLVRYPVLIERGERWDGVRPGSSEPFAIALPPAGRLLPSEVYVPAGWFWAGGDPEAVDSFPRRRFWCDPFVIQRFPVTNREYIAFLDDLVAQGREDEAMQHVPRERAGTDAEQGAVIYGFEEGRFSLRADADGNVWFEDSPVCMIDWYGAKVYCDWLAQRRGQQWRLPAELEWEKAARGVDGRFFPWGDALDPSWCCMRYSHQVCRVPAVIDTYPVDLSPFAARGMGGNMGDWCLDVSLEGAPESALVDPLERLHGDAGGGALRVIRGGAWSFVARFCRSAYRANYGPSYRSSYYGLRPARPLLEKRWR